MFEAHTRTKKKRERKRESKSTAQKKGDARLLPSVSKGGEKAYHLARRLIVGNNLVLALEVVREGLVHGEHAYPGLAKHQLELFVAHDEALILGILESVRLDVIPNQLNSLGS